MVFIVVLLCLFGGRLAQGESLREAAEGCFQIGFAIEPYSLDDPRFRDLLVREAGAVSTCNVLKPEYVQPVEGQFDFARADRILAFARQHGMSVTGHTLVWHQQTPEWFFRDAQGRPVGREQAMNRLRTHITTVMRHCRGQVKGWDVVNEAVSDKEGEYLRDTPWRRAIGDDYIEQACRIAMSADPDAELYYNDYNLEIPEKRVKAIRLIRELKAKGIRIDAVGLQGHYTLLWPENTPVPSAPSGFWPGGDLLADTIRDFSREGVKVMITELDINVLPGRYTGADVSLKMMPASAINPFVKGCPDSVLKAQAAAYAEIFRVLVRNADQVTRVTFWGLTDDDSWLNNWPVEGRTNYPLLFDREFRPKPAYEEVLRVLSAGPVKEKTAPAEVNLRMDCDSDLGVLPRFWRSTGFTPGPNPRRYERRMTQTGRHLMVPPGIKKNPAEGRAGFHEKEAVFSLPGTTPVI